MREKTEMKEKDTKAITELDLRDLFRDETIRDLKTTKFLLRELRLSEYEVDVCISSESLEKVLFDDEGSYTSREAQLLGETIFFYVPDDMLSNASDDELESYVTENLEW